MRRVLVIADCELPRASILKPLLERASLVIACDGGADRALAEGIRPDWIIGDMDGIRPQTLDSFPQKRVVRDEGRDRTDLEKAVAFVLKKRASQITITGAIGGRLDHTLGTLAVLQRYGRRVAMEVVDDQFTTTLVDRSTSFRAPAGTIISLLAPAGAQGVTTRGLRFDLTAHDLPFSPLGIHNEVRKSPVRVQVRGGDLLLLRGHHVRPHA